MRTVTLKQNGIRIHGDVLIKTWNDEEAEIRMAPKFLPLDKISKDNILSACNDGGFGAKEILAAKIDVCITYGCDRVNTYEEYQKTINIGHPDHLQKIQRGI